MENDGVDWIEEYKKKDALMTERGYPEIPPKEFYRDLFPAGSLQQSEGDGRGNVIG